jgi:type I restriction enzyme M protein
METLRVSNILDLGSGSGSLSTAAAERWNDAAITTVDVDSNVGAPLNPARGCAARHDHYSFDALDENLPSVMPRRDFELVLCNPPYTKPVWRDGFNSILSDAGFGALLGLSQDCVTSDMLFVAQLLRLCGSGAEIGLIVPDGFVSGDRYRAFREELLRITTVTRIVQLPRGSFRGTEAQAHIVTLRNLPTTGQPILLECLAAGRPVSPHSISVADARHRMDWGFYSSRPFGHSFTLRSLGAQVIRGILSSAEARQWLRPTFHTCDFPSEHVYECVLPKGGDPRDDSHVARTGDILLARVHRNLEKKLCMVERGSATITDCIYAIRLPESDRRLAFDALRQSKGQAALAGASRGVGPRMLGKRELLDMELEFPW